MAKNKKNKMDPELEAIMLRMNQLGRLMPDIDNIDLDNDAELAEAEMIVAEFNKAHADLFARMKVLRDAKA
jgi:hypothetical protein